MRTSAKREYGTEMPGIWKWPVTPSSPAVQQNETGIGGSKKQTQANWQTAKNDKKQQKSATKFDTSAAKVRRDRVWKTQRVWLTEAHSQCDARETEKPHPKDSKSVKPMITIILSRGPPKFWKQYYMVWDEVSATCASKQHDEFH